jgi:hypothetical protein
MRLRVEKRFGDAIKPFASTLRERFLATSRGRALHGKLFDAGRQTQRYNLVVRNIGGASRDEVLTANSIQAMERLNPLLAADFRMLAQMPKGEARREAMRGLRLDVENMRKLSIMDQKELALEARVAKNALRNPPGFVQFPHPQFSGVLFKAEDLEIALPLIRTVKETIGLVGERALTTVTGVSEVMRAGTLTLDYGFGLIQGLMVLPKAPRVWVKSVYASMAALGDSGVRRAYLATPEVKEVHEVFKGLLHIGSPEYMAAFQPKGLIPSALRGAEGLGAGGKAAASFARKLGTPFRAFQSSFEMFFDTARIEMAKAFIPAIKAGRVTADEVATHLNKMTGLTSSRRLGVSATQRELESAAIFLAARYTRGTVGLLADAFQGGFSGREARKALGLFFGGTLLAYTGLAIAFDQPVKLDPRSKDDGGDAGEFMTFEINGRNVGIGTKPYSMVRMLVKMGSEPENALHHALRWLRSNTSHPTGAMADTLTGRTFINERVTTPGEIFRHEVAGRLIPFYAEAALNDDPPPGMVGIAAGFLGFREFPESAAQSRDELRDELATFVPESVLSPDQLQEMERRGIETPVWEILTGSQKRFLAQADTDDAAHNLRAEELERWTGLARKKFQETGDEDINAFFFAQTEARTWWENEAKNRELGWRAGALSPKDFREEMGGLNAIYGSRTTAIYSPEGDHAEGLRKLDEFRAKDAFVPQEDIVRTVYLQRLVANPALTNAFGEYRFDEAARIERDLRSQYGDVTIDRIQEGFRTNKDSPVLWKEWIADREMMVRYWRVRDRYLASHARAARVWKALESAKNRRELDIMDRLGTHPEIVKMNRELRAERQAIRERSPALDALLIFWGYASKPLTTRARLMVGAKNRRLRVT